MQTTQPKNYNKALFMMTRGHWCEVVRVIIAIGFAFPIAFMAMDRNDPIVIHSTAISGDLRPGGKAEIVWTATAVRSCEGTATRRLVSSTGIVYDYARHPTVIRPRGEPFIKQEYRREFALPASLAPGIATVRTYVTYYCNPLQRFLDWPIVAVRPDAKFMVKE